MAGHLVLLGSHSYIDLRMHLLRHQKTMGNLQQKNQEYYEMDWQLLHQAFRH